MDHTIWAGVLAIALALFFDFSNGFNDSANQVATVISSRALPPEYALPLAAAADFAGAYFLGTSVAATIGRGILRPEAIQNSGMGIYVLISATIGALSWNVITWYFGIPASSSHSLIGGMLGAFLAGVGADYIQWKNVKSIMFVMILSPLIGFTVTYFFTKLTFFVAQWFTPRVNSFFKGLQVFSLIGQSLAHGTNDAQKSMGLITFVLFLMNALPLSSSHDLVVPHWVVLSCSLAIAAGVASGGWRIIRKLGSGLYRIRPIHGFAAQSASAGIMYAASVFGFPVSTTQVMSTSVMGAGAAFRPKAVRWEVGMDMLTAWLLTIPASGLLAAAIYKIMEFFIF